MTDTPARDGEALESLVGRLVDDFIERRERGEEPDVEEYARQSPEHAAVIRQVLFALCLVRSASPGAELPTDGVARAASPDACLGDFRILREVGRGGMGVVYEAEQVSLRRRVALKVLPFAAAVDGKRLQRFRNEAQAAAQLHHTNIVPVYAVGSDRGVHYYAMQLIDGRCLTELIADLRHERARGPQPKVGPPDPEATSPHHPAAGRDTAPAIGPAAAISTRVSATGVEFFRTAARLGLQAAEALDYAHQMGVVHRDIKPANLLVDDRGNLWITDFGLAHLQGEANLTVTGDLLGTLRYMSPEQALAKRVPIDHRTDIYSLGVTLYELLTQEPAVGGADRQEVFRRIAFEEPVAPRRLNRGVPTELETVVLKAMAKNVGDRYATAQELADDLRRFLEDRPVRARRPSLITRLRKWHRRHQAVVNWTAVAGALGLTLALLVLLVQNRRVETALNAEKEAKEREARKVEELDHTLYWRNIALAELELSAIIPRVAVAEKYLDDCPPHLRGWEWHCLKRKRYGTVTIRPHPPHSNGVPYSAAFSADGRRLAVLTVPDRRVLLLDAVTGDEVSRPLERPDGGSPRAAFSPDGRFLAVQTLDPEPGRGKLAVWDLRDNKQLLLEEVDHSVYNAGPAFAFAPDGRLALLTAAGKEVRFVEPVGGVVLGIFKPPAPAELVGLVALSRDGTHLAAADRQGNVHVWETATGRPVRRLERHGERVTAIAFSPDGRSLAAAGGSQGAAVWDIRSGEKLRTLPGIGATRDFLNFSPDGRFLVANTITLYLRVWDLETGKVHSSPEGDGPAFNPSDGRLAFASGKTVTLRDLAAARDALVLHDHDSRLFMVAFSPDGRRLASVCTDGTVRIHDATPLEERPGPQLRTLPHPTAVGCVAYSPDRAHLVTGGLGGTVQFWDAATGAGPVREFRTAGGTRLACSPDGRRFAAGGPDGRVIVCDAASGATVHILQHRSYVVTVAWSPDGTHIASSTADEVHVWDAVTGKRAFALADGAPPALPAVAGGAVTAWAPPAIGAVAFSPDGRFIASAVPNALGSRLVVWDRGGKVVARLQQHPLVVVSVAFAPDSRHVATGTFGTTLRVGDIRTGQVRLLDGHDEAVFALAFSPDGHFLASGSHDGAVKVWDWEKFPPATPEQLVASLRTRRLPNQGPDPITLRGHRDKVWSVAFSLDGGHLASSGGTPDGGEAMIWERKLWDKSPARP